MDSPRRQLGLLLLLLCAGSAPARAGGHEDVSGGSGSPAAGGAVTVPAPDACADRSARRVQEHYQAVRDLRARFVQRQESVAFAGSALEQAPVRGEVHFAKPGRMRWSYQDPEPSLVVSDGATLWIYDPTAREVQVLPVEQGFLSGAAFQFLLGEGRIADAFRVSAESCGPDTVRLALTPREESTYQLLRLWVDARTGSVRQTEVVDLFGNRTHVAFEGVETNLDPPQELFRFEVPEGVRVLELPGS